MNVPGRVRDSQLCTQDAYSSLQLTKASHEHSLHISCFLGPVGQIFVMEETETQASGCSFIGWG